MFKKTPLCKGLMLAFGGSVVLGMLPSAAKAQRVEITGSSIRQISSESALPVTVLKTDDLAKAGVTNAEQALAFITSNQSSINAAYSVGATNGGASFADLRGLGPTRTLVLVNGKRMVNNPYDGGISAVDVNTVPYGAVERIEVLNDGASAIYGSDAVAGVVNFITRREYQGLTLTGALSQPTTSGGGQNYELGATGGIGSLSEQGWNLFGSVGYRSQASLAALDRSFSSTAYLPRRGVDYTSPLTFPANYSQFLADGSEAVFNPSLPDCNPPTAYPTAFGDCGFNYARYTDTIPSQEQWSLMAKGSYAVDKNNTVSLEFLQGNNTMNSVIAPSALDYLTIAGTNPFFPGGPGQGGVPGTPIGDPPFDPSSTTYVNWRTANLGSRTNTIVNKTNRFLLDWQGAYEGWDYSVAALRSNANVTNSFDRGYVNEAAMQAGLEGTPFGPGGATAPWLNPFGAQTAEGQAFMLNQRILGRMQDSEGTLQGVKAEASGQIYKLPAGPLTMGVGIEHYRDKTSFTNSPLLSEAASSGLDGVEDASGSRNWTGLFAEFNIPVLKELEVNLALRYDNYSDFGSTTNPKASVRWAPTKDLLIRGSVNSGFRAPSLYETYSPTSFTNIGGFFTDPILCPGGTVDVAAGGVESRDCNTNSFDQQVGGNKNLDPETSTAWGVGIVFQPTSTSTVSVDYWNYVIKDSIGVSGESAILNDPTTYASNYVRCSTLTPEVRADFNRCQVPGGDPVAYIVNTNLNLGTYRTSGLDFSAAWRGQATSYGRFSAAWQATYVLQYEYQLASGGAYINNLGNMSSGNAITRYRQVLNLGWQQGPWTMNLINRFTSGYTDQNIYVEPEYYNKVGSVNTWDLAATWTGVKNLSLTAGLTNMFNQEPPFSNNADGAQVGFDYRYGNPIGRAFIMRAVYTF